MSDLWLLLEDILKILRFSLDLIYLFDASIALPFLNIWSIEEHNLLKKSFFPLIVETPIKISRFKHRKNVWIRLLVLFHFLDDLTPICFALLHIYLCKRLWDFVTFGHFELWLWICLKLLWSLENTSIFFLKIATVFIELCLVITFAYLKHLLLAYLISLTILIWLRQIREERSLAFINGLSVKQDCFLGNLVINLQTFCCPKIILVCVSLIRDTSNFIAVDLTLL